MVRSHHTLSDKEKQTLRLLVAGHDAKSMARQLGLSVHTVNERLRDSRRKLSVSSSREAARLLRDAEAAAPDLVGDEHLGDAARTNADEHCDPSIASGTMRRPAVWIIGVIAMLSLTFALLVLSPAAPQADAPDAPAASTSQAETAPVQAARQWLEMGDAADWKGSYDATGASFRKLNSLALWTSVSEKVRVPLGAVRSRTLIGAEDVPTPPNGNMVVKFRTRFANRAEAVETIALTREDGSWKVVGCYLE